MATVTPTNLSTQRVTVTLPNPLPSGVTCFIRHYDDTVERHQVFISFNQFLYDDDYLTTFTLETISDFIKAYDNNEESFDPDCENWYILIREPITFEYY